MNEASIFNCENLKLDFGARSKVSFGQVFLISKEKHCIGHYYFNDSSTGMVIFKSVGLQSCFRPHFKNVVDESQHHEFV